MKTAVQWSVVLADLEEVAADNDSAPAFFERLLSELSMALEANAAACWMFSQEQSVGLLAEFQFSALGLRDDLQGTRLHQRILSDTFTARAARVVPIQVRNSPAIAFVLLVPLVHKGDCIGVVEFFASGEPWQLDAEIHRVLNSVISLTDRYLERLEELTRITDPSGFLEDFAALTTALHRRLDPVAVAVTAVNDTAAILKCDRATLLLKHGSRWEVISVSGRSSVNPRSNQIQLLQRLAQITAVSRDVLMYTGNDDAIPAPVAESLAAYVGESGTRMLMLRPLFEPVSRKHGQAETASQDRRDGRLWGAIILEQFTTSRPGPSLRKYADPICDQVSLAMSNALAYRRIPLLPLLDFMGQQLENVRRKASVKVAVVLCCCMVTIAVLSNTHAAYHVNASGKLMPAVQRRVFTEFDGEVDRVLVKPGARVDAGTPLITLKNDAFEDELLLLRSQRDERRKSLLGLNSELHTASKTGNREHLLQLQAGIEECRIDVASLQHRIGQVEKKIARMTLRAPIAGTVVTFVDEQQLIGKPVRRGDTLLEIMDESGLWRLELEVPEHRMHHVQHGISTYGEEVPATFRLTADPAHEFSGWLSHTAERSTISLETGSVVKIRVSLNDTPDLPKRIGADVRSRLECGDYSLLHVWFGDAVEYARREFWF